MSQVRVFLRTELFTYDGAEGHVPRGTAIIDGATSEGLKGGLTVSATASYDLRGTPLQAAPSNLFLPLAKIDHLLLVEGS